ncbi:MAG: GtrA family protein [Isosphaeraceae bacterium]
MPRSESLGGTRGPVRLSLVLPLLPHSALDPGILARYRRLLESAGFEIETVLVGSEAVLNALPHGKPQSPDDDPVLIPSGVDDWSELARAGLWSSTGDYLLVLDVERHYSPESLLTVLGPVLSGRAELAVAVPSRPGWLGGMGLRPIRAALGLVSRLVLGSSEVFSGLFVVDRSLWHRGGRLLEASGPSLVLELLLRRPDGCADVPAAVGPEFRSQGLRFRDLRPLKHVLDGRYGSWSRLIQFCFVGASGMVVDLSLYALFQWMLSFTPLYTSASAQSGFSWHLAVAGALSISTALVWNFTLNRRLTFNDARGDSWIRQFLTYALGNALAIALNFSIRLYLPTRLAFFDRHRLAAAVVGIVVATGISFSMSRWIVFARKPAPAPATPIAEPAQVSSPSAIA